MAQGRYRRRYRRQIARERAAQLGCNYWEHRNNMFCVKCRACIRRGWRRLAEVVAEVARREACRTERLRREARAEELG
jgi:hypothetical protein